jgi:fermentation-respiration switch protein FrsA (DUF1100 family)
MHTASKAQRFIVILLSISGILALIYATVSIGLAMILIYQPQMPVTQTPSSRGLSYRSVTFLSRDDHLLLRGWFIPGILPGKHMTVERTIILVHGLHANRATNLILDLSADLARRGFAVLDFDLRGHGESTPAPFGGGYFEQRDVLGAVDYLRSGPLPYPELGRPRAIGAWGNSLGGVAILFAAVLEPAIKGMVIDSAYATMESLVRYSFGPASIFVPGVLAIAQMLYGVDFFKVRAVDVVAKIAPRPILFIHGANDKNVLPSNMTELATAASAAPNAQVQSWLVPGAGHIQGYTVMKNAYLNRIVTLYTAGLGIAS